jgi:homoserine dehydrogenase
MMMAALRIGLLGFGTVGTGVVKWVQANAGLIADRTGVTLEIARIADLDLTTDRGVAVAPGVLTDDANSVINDPEIDVIVELVGGTGIAKTFVLQALANGKPVVTANKALLAHYGHEIFPAAADSGADLYYEASVAGGIPIIKAVREGLAANHFTTVYGILNGTCNYILTRMEYEGIDFDTVLAEAQELGYAEAEPSLDIDGPDTAHKTCIMASLAFGEWFGMDGLHMEGIRGLALEDIRNAADAGYRIKVLGVVKLEDGRVQMRVHPALVPLESMLGSVDGVFNAVWVHGDAVGDTMFYGRGAGQDATASAVVGDLIDVGLNLNHASPHRVPAFQPRRHDCERLDMADVRCRYYLRLNASDEPSVLARITQILGKADISIASISQKEAAADTVPVVIITHTAREGDVNAALAEISALDVVSGEPVRLRIEDV